MSSITGAANCSSCAHTPRLPSALSLSLPTLSLSLSLSRSGRKSPAITKCPTSSINTSFNCATCECQLPPTLNVSLPSFPVPAPLPPPLKPSVRFQPHSPWANCRPAQTNRKERITTKKTTRKKGYLRQTEGLIPLQALAIIFPIILILVIYICIEYFYIKTNLDIPYIISLRKNRFLSVFSMEATRYSGEVLLKSNDK